MTMNLDKEDQSPPSIRLIHHPKNQVVSLNVLKPTTSSVPTHSKIEMNLFWDESIHTLHQFGTHSFNRISVLFE